MSITQLRTCLIKGRIRNSELGVQRAPFCFKITWDLTRLLFEA